DVKNVALLYRKRGKPLAGLEVLYEFRRSHYDEPHAHKRYIEYVLDKTMGELRLPDTPIAADSTCVFVECDGAPAKWFEIDASLPDDLRHSRLSSSHPIAVAVMGHATGEEVHTKGTGAPSVRVKLIEVQSKYVRAFRESTESFGGL